MRIKKSGYNTKVSKLLKNKKILVSGGAGSIGSALIKKLLEYPVNQVRVLYIDEHALFRLKHAINDSRLRMLLGSILDKDRIQMAGNNADIIIHTAAIKNIEISEYNPIETIETNIHGTVNMIKMAMQNKVKLFTSRFIINLPKYEFNKNKVNLLIHYNQSVCQKKLLSYKELIFSHI